MIIIEGCDGAGKTQLALTLANHFNLPVLRNRKPQSPEDIRDFHYWAAAAPTVIILDRHAAISDLVYGPILRDHTHSSTAAAFAFTLNHFLIYCRPPASILDQPQMNGVSQNLLSLQSAYDSLMDEINPDFTYDFNNQHHLPALIQQLLTYLSRAA